MLRLRILLKSTVVICSATVHQGYPPDQRIPRCWPYFATLLALFSPPDSFGALITEFFVANIKSQIKRNKQNEVARERNKAVKSEIRTRTKNAVSAAGTENEESALRAAMKRIDKAAAKKVIHKNQAANKKSGLMKRINALKTNA